jgi:hypothetical protein
MFIQCPPQKSQFRHVAHVVRLCDQAAINFQTRKHIILICSSRNNTKLAPISVDFIPYWTSVFIHNIGDSPSRFSVLPSTHQSDSVSSIARLLRLSSWVDVIDISAVDIFGVINFTIGSLGFASMLNSIDQSQAKEVGDAVYWMLKDPTLKGILESKV